MSGPEACGTHQQVSVDLDAFGRELQQIAGRLKEMRRILAMAPNAEPLRLCLVKAHVALELADIYVRECGDD